MKQRPSFWEDYQTWFPWGSVVLLSGSAWFLSVFATAKVIFLAPGAPRCFLPLSSSGKLKPLCPPCWLNVSVWGWFCPWLVGMGGTQGYHWGVSVFMLWPWVSVGGYEPLHCTVSSFRVLGGLPMHTRASNLIVTLHVRLSFTPFIGSISGSCSPYLPDSKSGSFSPSAGLLANPLPGLLESFLLHCSHTC